MEKTINMICDNSYYWIYHGLLGIFYSVKRPHQLRGRSFHNFFKHSLHCLLYGADVEIWLN